MCAWFFSLLNGIICNMSLPSPPILLILMKSNLFILSFITSGLHQKRKSFPNSYFKRLISSFPFKSCSAFSSSICFRVFRYSMHKVYNFIILDLVVSTFQNHVVNILFFSIKLSSCTQELLINVRVSHGALQFYSVDLWSIILPTPLFWVWLCSKFNGLLV